MGSRSISGWFIVCENKFAPLTELMPQYPYRTPLNTISDSTMAAAGPPVLNARRRSGPCVQSRNATIGTTAKIMAGLRSTARPHSMETVSYTHLRAHETPEHLVCRLLLE